MKQGVFVELHVIQSFAPSNLNRDDTGAPKSCVFGGVPRARISSQCLKRTAREFVKERELLKVEELATRSRRFIGGQLAPRLAALGTGRSLEQARTVVDAALRGVKLESDSDGRTKVLLYLGEGAVNELVAVCNEHWPDLIDVVQQQVGSKAGAKPGQSKSQAKKAAAGTIPAKVQDAVTQVLRADRASDLAMFGRMLADLPDARVDAACQVAHAISTHEVRSELDYWTAVDELNPNDTAGAGMIGAMEFNSACYYRYLNIDVQQLLGERNLDNDRELAWRTVGAFLQASLLATPRGKQNGTGARSPLALAMTVVRTTTPLSLVNAFERPVHPTETDGIIEGSIRRLERHFTQLREGYGAYGGVTRRLVWSPDPELDLWPTEERVRTLTDLVGETVVAAFPDATVGSAA